MQSSCLPDAFMALDRLAPLPARDARVIASTILYLHLQTEVQQALIAPRHAQLRRAV